MSAPSKIWDRLADLALSRRPLGLGFIALALVGLACLPKLHFDFSPQTLFDSTSETARVWREYREIYGADDHVIVLLAEAPAAQLSTWELLVELEAAIDAEVPGVERVRSLASQPIPRSPIPGHIEIAPYPFPRSDAEAAALAAQARDHPLLRNTLISPDGEAVVVFMKARDDIAAMSEVGPLIESLKGLAARIGGEHATQLHLLGPHAYRATVVGVMIREELRFVPLTAVVLFAVLFVLFRSVAGVMIPLLSVGLGALWTLAAMALAGQGINIINTITATLILVIGVADAIHMMTRYGQERRSGFDRPDAMRRALRSVGIACLLTSLTTAVGFLTLQTAHLEILRDFGLFAALGVMLTFGLTIVFVPWALVRSPIDPVVRDPERGLDTEANGLLGRLLTAQKNLVLRHPRTVALLCLALAAAFAAGIPRARVDNYIMEYVPRGDPILRAHQVLEEKLAGIVYLDVLLEAEGDQPWLDPSLLQAAARAEELALAEEAVQAVDSPLALLRELRWVQRGGVHSDEPRDALPRTRREVASLLLLAEIADGDTLATTHLSFDRRVLRITTRAADVGAASYIQLERRLRAALEESFADSPGPIRVQITGTSQVGYSGIDSLIKDLLRSLVWAFVLIFGTLVVLFRSLRLGALAMLPNLMPLVIVLGAMGWTGRHLETLSAMVFSIGLGIAVDDTIHYLARWCEERRAGLTVEEAVTRTTERTGRAIVYTSIVLLLGFGVLYTSAFPPNKSFAVLASGVIGSALVADLFLLPALLLWLRPPVPGAEPS